MSSDANSSGDKAAAATAQLLADADTLRHHAEASEDIAAANNELRERRLRELFMEQQSQPFTLNNFTLHGAKNTRRSFLDPIIAPLLAEASNSTSTLGDVMLSLRGVVNKLDRLEIFHPEPNVWISSAEGTDPSASATDANVDLRVRELGRFKLKTGTDVGDGESSAYGSLLWRNIFGGAEMLSLNASTGTRTRSAYGATFSLPVLSNPDLRLAVDGLGSSTHKPWASHEEVLKGGNVRLSWLSPESDLHTVEYSGMWRQITGLYPSASPSVRAEAGDSVKSSVRHTFQRDRRDNRHLPQDGYVVRSNVELAGVGPLGGDVGFAKGDVDVGGALPIPIPGVQGPSGFSIGGGLKLGVLYPLALGNPFGGEAKPSRISDRFQLGGPNDVRGFKLGGLGPHDGADAVGGDMFAAGSVNLLMPLPYKGPESGLRMQAFLSAGRLVALRPKGKGRQTGEGSSGGMDGRTVRDGMARAFRDIWFSGAPPSVAAGFGLVYGHPMARFELNFGLPLAMARGEQCTKGLQVGVGINFL
ncbi:related to cell surface protein homologous to bacterial outer membrane proteins [Cephalotrichum gorgonifer]|uniref:Related to cell surface protein homologous to bacterial outer membrane proteins n=1 Tax=Cephalotrichum gorgonifer TaxID=2041049 RepID=A0AAE8N651_9PEZI|nr:related to cell surface protein homologous to bacterial outer membrane proteins [Cephalotrichum gorgonifer]